VLRNRTARQERRLLWDFDMGDRLPRGSYRLSILALVLLVGTFAAACSNGGSSSSTAPATAAASEAAPTSGTTADTAAADTGTTPAETTPATTSPETETPPADASCAADHDPGTAEALACSWIAAADPAVCDRMSDRLLGELFGASGMAGLTQCRSVLGGLTPAEDAGLVTLGAPERRGKRATLVLTDGNQDIVYAFEFRRAGGRWTIDKVQQLENAGADASGEAAETVTPSSPGDDGEIAALLTRWYVDVDPGVCDSMTDAMLAFGWGAKGSAGRSECEAALADADPVADVEVRKPSVTGSKATAAVVYTLDGERQVDEIGLVRVNGAWLVDSTRLAGFAE
jgi:hypothetical protein